MHWTERLTAAYKNFPLAPPDYPGAPYRPRLPEPPYAQAPGWQCSVYYYWWEYLRRHDGYRITCANAGAGDYAALYKYFGDVHISDFNTWWDTHLWLFTFVSEAQDISLSEKFFLESEGIFLHVGYSRSKTQMLDAVRETLNKLDRRQMLAEMKREYRFYPTGRPRLPSLHEHLLVWDAKIANPELDDADLFDISGVTATLPYSIEEISDLRAERLSVVDLEKINRRAKALVVQRHLRIAQQYIHNVGLGKFPKRDKR
jgi:hypothetical protein